MKCGKTVPFLNFIIVSQGKEINSSFTFLVIKLGLQPSFTKGRPKNNGASDVNQVRLLLSTEGISFSESIRVSLLSQSLFATSSLKTGPMVSLTKTCPRQTKPPFELNKEKGKIPKRSITPPRTGVIFTPS